MNNDWKVQLKFQSTVSHRIKCRIDKNCGRFETSTKTEAQIETKTKAETETAMATSNLRILSTYAIRKKAYAFFGCLYLMADGRKSEISFELTVFRLCDFDFNCKRWWFSLGFYNIQLLFNFWFFRIVSKCIMRVWGNFLHSSSSTSTFIDVPFSGIVSCWIWRGFLLFFQTGFHYYYGYYLITCMYNMMSLWSLSFNKVHERSKLNKRRTKPCWKKNHTYVHFRFQIDMTYHGSNHQRFHLGLINMKSFVKIER